MDPIKHSLLAHANNSNGCVRLLSKILQGPVGFRSRETGFDKFPTSGDRVDKFASESQIRGAAFDEAFG